MGPIHKTGVVCPSCKQPVGIIVNILKDVFVLKCQSCGNRWSGTSPATKQQ